MQLQNVLLLYLKTAHNFVWSVSTNLPMSRRLIHNFSKPDGFIPFKHHSYAISLGFFSGYSLHCITNLFSWFFDKCLETLKYDAGYGQYKYCLILKKIDISYKFLQIFCKKNNKSYSLCMSSLRFFNISPNGET